jgi:hypothetical protein
MITTINKETTRDQIPSKQRKDTTKRGLSRILEKVRKLEKLICNLLYCCSAENGN